MSLTSTLRPTGLPFSASTKGNGYGHPVEPAQNTFFHDSNYLQLSRMLVRLQNVILLAPSPNANVQPFDLTTLQRRIQAELWSPLPYHRTKWLHTIDGARNLLLQLERTALGIKIQRTKKDAVRDLAEKRTLIKKLKNRVEEIGREVENMGEKAWNRRSTEDDELLGQRADEVLGKIHKDEEQIARGDKNDLLQEGKPVADAGEEHEADASTQDQRDVLFGSSLRRRHGQATTTSDTSSAISPNKGQASGFSNLQSTERLLADSSRTQEDLTTSLVSMAAQLKQQSRAFQFSLEQDKGLLDRALDGLDRNISGMEIASKNMAFLRRMSEGEGWWGRIKLYAIIFGMWLFAVLLVFVGPKLRF